MTTDARRVSHGTWRSVTPSSSPNDGRKGKHQDDVVHRDLHERVVHVTLGQVTPDEDHGHARRDPEQDHARDVLLGVVGQDEAGEDVLEEQDTEPGHGEGLDEPVHDERRGRCPWASCPRP